ncbi:MAG: metallophosphatase family protein [Chloroflexota bacterium]|nr:metallophosphatase family protein [Chloroflexota bacterium]
MRIGIVADIHANLPAFVRVLTQLKAAGAADHLWCLGDMVGYGPWPNECLELLQTHSHLCLPGNHDWGVIGRTEAVLFNDAALFVLNWTKEQLSRPNWTYLEALSLIQRVPAPPFTLVHGSPRDPIWEYLVETKDASPCFRFFDTPICLVGHSHLPLVFRKAAGKTTVSAPSDGTVLQLGTDRLIINPGSVGQPRNGDPRAHYAILDTAAHTISFHRVVYPIVLTQARMRELDFPPLLIKRLDLGQ